MDQRTLRLLGFSRILEIIQTFAQSSLGKEQVLRIAPLTDRQEIDRKLARVEEGRRYRAEKDVPDFGRLQDPQATLENLAVQGQILEPRECLVLLDLLKIGKKLKSIFSRAQWPLLAERLEYLAPPDQVIREIEQALNSSGEVQEAADPELGVTRRRQAECREKVQEHLRHYFKGSRARFLIEEPFLTVRSGRYVIPVQVQHQRSVPGIVHGTSSSGATVFLEPFTAVELNNQCVYYRELEQEIIHRVLRQLTGSLQPCRRQLWQIAEKAAELDAVFACAAFADRFRCVAPTLSDKRVFRLREARHPLLADGLGEDGVVPILIQLSEDQNALILSGPNTGGKTVALKTVGLFSIMAQCGLPVSAAEAELAVFDQVLADIGDQQSIDEQLSTFSAHILRIKRMIETVKTPSLILLDEVGRGTDPVHGSVLAIAVIDFFRRKETLIVATTHHQSVKSLAFTMPGVESASVELDSVTLRPTYTLRYGIAGVSSGLEIAFQLGLPEPIVAKARGLLQEREIQAESYLGRLREELVVLSQERDKTRVRMEQLRERENQLEVEFKQKEREQKLANERSMREWETVFRRETGQFLKTVQDRFERTRLKREIERKEVKLKEAFRQKMAAQRKQEPPNVKEGDSVFHRLFRKRGRIMNLENGEATLEIEGKRITTTVDQLEKIAGKDSPKRTPQNVTLNVVEEKVEPELNLIGCTVEEALMRVDKFLDQAFLSDLREVRIIHGFGSGRLKVALSEFLRAHPHASKHRVEGGTTRVVIEE